MIAAAAAAALPRRGRLTVILGYAAGVGKTCRMLDEGRRLKDAGRDVVIGLLETHGRRETADKAAGFEVVPRRTVMYRGCAYLEMDAEAVINRRPQTCIVDELAHTNVPGSGRAKRWEDVQAILEAGIDVYTTMNIQHLESLNDQIQVVSGVKVRETVPDTVLDRADEIVVVDVTPAELIDRLNRGLVYDPPAAQRALENFFRASTLDGLRELVLRQAAHEVEARRSQPARPTENILVHVTADPFSSLLVRRGRRIADHLRLGLIIAVVTPDGSLSSLPTEDKEAVGLHLNLARRLNAETRLLAGKDVAASLIGCAQRERVTQILLLRPDNVRRLLLTGDDLIARLVRLARGIRVTFVAPRRFQPAVQVHS